MPYPNGNMERKGITDAYYAKDLTFVNLFENIPKIEGKKMGENSSFKLDLKHFEIKSNGKTIYIIQKNNQDE